MKPDRAYTINALQAVIAYYSDTDEEFAAQLQVKVDALIQEFNNTLKQQIED